jgi:hypothetical protein
MRPPDTSARRKHRSIWRLPYPSSTSIHDVVHPYATERLVRIADKPNDFVEAVTAALNEDHAARVARSDAFLAGMSWDRTWAAMDARVHEVVEGRLAGAQPRVAVAA